MTVKRIAQIICLVSLAPAAVACIGIQELPTHTPVPTDTSTVTSPPTSTPTATLASTSTPTVTYTPASTLTITPTPKPEDVRLISGLEISNVSPLVGERVKATFKVRNYGEQTFEAAKLLVKGRGPDDSIQDFRPIDNFLLDPGAEYTYSEYRSFSAPGKYWFTPHYSPDGVWNWLDITWPDGRPSVVELTVLQDNTPEVRIYVEPSTIYQGATAVIEITASDDFGVQSIRWWSEDIGDESLNQGGEFVYDGGIGSFDKSWTLTWTGKNGKFTIYAQARDTAGQLSSVASTTITVLPTATFSLLVGGGPFNDTSVQVALGFAVNWAALREEIGEVVLVGFSSGETLAGPTEPAYDLNLARKLLAEAGYDGFDAVLLFDPDDELATRLTDLVDGYLSVLGIRSEYLWVASADARDKFVTMIAAGESGLLIERR